MTAVGNRLSDMEFDEVSLVQRPANQLSKVVLFKSDDTEEDNMPVEQEEQEPIAKKGRRKIQPRPDFPPMEDEMDEEMMDEEEVAEEEAEEPTPRKKGKMAKNEDEMIDLPTEVFEYVEALEAANAELMAQIEKMSGGDPEDDDETADIMKSADPRIVEIIKAAEERAAAAEMIAKAERDYRLEREFVSKAAQMTNIAANAEEFGKVLKTVAESVDTDTFARLWQVLDAANTAAGTSGAFKEIGKSAWTEDSPMGRLEQTAARLRESNPSLTREQAISKALDADPSLYTSYLREGK